MTNNPYEAPKQADPDNHTRSSAIALVLVAVIITAGIIGYRNFQLRSRLQAAAAETALRRATKAEAVLIAEETRKSAESTPPNATIP